MGRSTPTFRQYATAEYREWMRMGTVLPERQRKALKELLNAALIMSDAGSIVANPVPSETMIMLMMIHIASELNEMEQKLAGESGQNQPK